MQLASGAWTQPSLRPIGYSHNETLFRRATSCRLRRDGSLSTGTGPTPAPHRPICRAALGCQYGETSPSRNYYGDILDEVVVKRIVVPGGGERDVVFRRKGPQDPREFQSLCAKVCLFAGFFVTGGLLGIAIMQLWVD